MKRSLGAIVGFGGGALFSLAAMDATSLQLLVRPGPWKQTAQLQLAYDQHAESTLSKQDDNQSTNDSGHQNWRLGGSWTIAAPGDHALLADFSIAQRSLDLDHPLTSSYSGEDIAGDYTHLSFGIQGRYVDQSSRKWVSRLGVSMLSDDIEDDDDARRVHLFSSVNIPSKSNSMNSWLFGINWHSHQDFPIPLIAYSWIKGRELQITLGAPFLMINWMPNKHWQINLRQFAVRPSAEITYRPIFPIGIFMNISQDSWIGVQADRSDDEASVRSRYWRLGGGASFAWARGQSVKVDLGWQFEHDLTEQTGWNVYDTERNTLSSVDDSFFIKAALNYAW